DLVVRVRRPPPIDPARPLHGLRVAVDAGHPPAGATGPTRLKEADANLWIAQALVPMLEGAGAHVIMIRRDTAAVALGDRPQMAADSNAHVLVSVHNNAFPDGVNPFENNGTSVYYFHPQSASLAQHMQAELLHELRLRDIGIGRADLALVRPTWMPAVLTETMFLMIPQQEAALRNPDVQRRIAEAHVRALEAFLRERAGVQSRIVSTRSRRSALCALVVCALSAAMAGSARAQVDPGARYRIRTTSHFRVTYQQDLEPLARHAAQRAEVAFAILSRTLTRPPQLPIDIVIADDRDYTNGMTTPLPSNRIWIYAKPPVELPSLAFNEDWL